MTVNVIIGGSDYSEVPNKRAGPNIQVGWKQQYTSMVYYMKIKSKVGKNLEKQKRACTFIRNLRVFRWKRRNEFNLLTYWLNQTSMIVILLHFVCLFHWTILYLLTLFKSEEGVDYAIYITICPSFWIFRPPYSFDLHTIWNLNGCFIFCLLYDLNQPCILCTIWGMEKERYVIGEAQGALEEYSK
jgi:hypothetical protein